jgi:hypothetical protein
MKSPRSRSRYLLHANGRRFSFRLRRSMRDIRNCTC